MDTEQLPERALRKLNACVEANSWMAPLALTWRAEWVVRYKKLSMRCKFEKLYEIADMTVAALAPFVACNQGCSICCHEPVLIYECEAIRMANASGRVMVSLPHRHRRDVFMAAFDYVRQPCPFLADNQCSIYDDRPLVCRLRNSFSDESKDCHIRLLFKHDQKVAQYDPFILEIPCHRIVEACHPTEPWGSIQEFFPIP